MLYRKDMAEYGAARSLRIYPALIVHVFFVMMIAGPFVTNLPMKEFFTHPDFWTQPFQVLTFAETNMALPGAFATSHEQIGSGALWTLRYEVLAYIGTAIAFSLGLLKHKWMLLMQFLIFVAAWPIAKITGIYDQVPATVQAILRFGLAYGLGAAIYGFRDKLSFNLIGLVLLGLVTALFNGTILFEIMTTLWLGYIVFWMAYVKIPALNSLKKLSDTSYGIYIYHWVILQWVFYKMPGLNPWELMAIAMPITILIAYASWHIVEKPMLKRKVSMSRWIKSKFGKADPAIVPAE